MRALRAVEGDFGSLSCPGVTAHIGKPNGTCSLGSHVAVSGAQKVVSGNAWTVSVRMLKKEKRHGRTETVREGTMDM